LLRDMDAAGVDRAVLLGWYWQNQANCEAQNRFYADCVRAHPGRLAAFATVQPAAGAAALAEVRRARDDGLIGLGELSPHSQGVAINDERWLAVLALAEELLLPVNLHVTEPEGRAYPGRVETPQEDFLAMARAWPRVRFILAHWGGRLWRTGAACPGNVWLDTAASPLLYGEDGAVWRDGLAYAGNKVLWGTDYPLDLYPNDHDKSALTGFLTETRTRLTPAAAEKVLGRGATVFPGMAG